uniref:Uncharacterized protein n=1 Tax=Opuntia streptacantha TaxID=393608 RepID=A0A7C9DC02_OPUST
MKFKVACRKVYDYIRYDLKEIAFPSSLPDPPHIKKRPKLTLKEWYYVVKEASRLYAASWVRDIGPELRPNDYKKKDESVDRLSGIDDKEKDKEPTTLEDLAVAARGGMETLRPALQRLYMTRASAYKDALKGFIEGYQEGIQQVMEHKQKEESELLKKEFESLKAGIREVVEQKKKEESEWLKEDGSKKSEEHELQKHEENKSKKTN